MLSTWNRILDGIIVTWFQIQGLTNIKVQIKWILDISLIWIFILVDFIRPTLIAMFQSAH